MDDCVLCVIHGFRFLDSCVPSCVPLVASVTRRDAERGSKRQSRAIDSFFSTAKVRKKEEVSKLFRKKDTQKSTLPVCTPHFLKNLATLQYVRPWCIMNANYNIIYILYYN